MAKKNEDGLESVDTDVNGQGRIPGTEVVVVKEIQKFVKLHEATKDEHKLLTQKLESENDQAVALYEKYPDHFHEDRKGNFVYSDDSGARLQIIKPTKVTVKTSFDIVESTPVPDSSEGEKKSARKPAAKK